MAAKNPLAQKLVNEYRPLQVKYEGLAALICGIVDRLAKKVGRKAQMVTSRAKNADRLYEKIIRKKKEGKEYKKLDDIEDLAGARIIFYFESDRKAFMEELRTALGEKTIISAQEQLKPNGYRATHVILALDDSRTNLPEYSEYKGMKCELQITSALYHAWSEVEHDITYKPDGDRDKLIELGLDRLEGKFKELHEHIQGASIQLDLIREDYDEIRKFGSLLESDLIKQVSVSNNDKALEILNLVRNFSNKKPDEALAVTLAIFSKEPVEPEVLGILGTHKILGKTHSDVENAALEALSQLRYYKPDIVLNLILKLFKRKEQTIRGQAKKILEEFSKYNYTYIQANRNYGPQLTVLNFIEKWGKKEQLNNFDFIEAATHELLGSTVESTEWTKADTLTRHSGSVIPSKDLRKIRTKTLNLLSTLFFGTTKINLKLRILNILEQASRGPDYDTNPDVSDIIAKDAKHVLSIYKKAVFGENGNQVKGSLSVATEIESRLYWWGIWKLGGNEAALLREKILNDKFYKIARLMVGDPSVFYAEDKEKELKVEREEQIKSIVTEIQSKTLEEWYAKLERIAREKEYIDEWKFNTFRGFLSDLSNKKPVLAESLLAKSFKENDNLHHFADSFLEGFRLAGKENLWDKYLRLAKRNKDFQLTRALFNTLFVIKDGAHLKTIRKEDIRCIEDIARAKNGFEFLNGNNDWRLHTDLFRIICSLLSEAPKKMEELLRLQLSAHPELANAFFDTLGYFTFSNTLDIQSLSKPTKTALKRELVKINSLEWRSQDLLLRLSGNDLDTTLDVFTARIHFEEKYKKDKSPFDYGNRYEAVPYHLNPELADFITKHPDLKDRALGMLDKMTRNWSLYNWHVTHLFERAGAPGLISIVEHAISKGDEKSLLSAAYCMRTTTGGDLDICMKIIGKTDNKKAISQIDGAILSTGVVSGEYGLANAYKSKADAFKPYVRSRNKRIKDYSKRMISTLEKMSLRSKADADEEHTRRELSFES